MSDVPFHLSTTESRFKDTKASSVSTAEWVAIGLNKTSNLLENTTHCRSYPLMVRWSYRPLLGNHVEALRNPFWLVSAPNGSTMWIVYFNGSANRVFRDKDVLPAKLLGLLCLKIQGGNQLLPSLFARQLSRCNRLRILVKILGILIFVAKGQLTIEQPIIFHRSLAQIFYSLWIFNINWAMRKK